MVYRGRQGCLKYVEMTETRRELYQKLPLRKVPPAHMPTELAEQPLMNLGDHLSFERHRKLMALESEIKSFDSVTSLSVKKLGSEFRTWNRQRTCQAEKGNSW